MELAVSILEIINRQDMIDKLDNEKVKYLHLDVMDGVFVKNITLPRNDINYKKPVDIHLMTEEVEKYYNYYSNLDIAHITFHCETQNINEKISFLKQKNIKVGLAIKPNTDISLLLPYLTCVDLVLVMSVEPGNGGQAFMHKTYERVNYLKEYRKNNNLKYVIEVDGGINNLVYKQLNCDIAVVGSYITMSNNYTEKINGLVIE